MSDPAARAEDGAPAAPSDPPRPYKFVLLSHKDTDLLTLSSARHRLPRDFPAVDAADLCGLKVEADMRAVVRDVVAGADGDGDGPAQRVLVIVRLLGRGVPGFHHLIEHVHAHDHHLLVVSGVPGSFEPDLTAMCHNVSVATVNEVMKYFHADGCAANMANMLKYLADHVFRCGFGHDPAVRRPEHGLYHPRCAAPEDAAAYLRDCRLQNAGPVVAVVFYRCHYLSGNTAFVDALLDELEALGARGVGLFTETLRAHEPVARVNGRPVERFPTALTHLLAPDTGDCLVDVVVSSMAFAMGEVNADGPTLGNWSAEGLRALNVPVLQAINSVGSYEEWQESARGLNPLDTAMNVAIPEFDGRIITVPISFLAPVDETEKVQYYAPAVDRVAQVAKQAHRLAILRRKPNAEKRVAFVLTNSSGKAERIGDAVGLDTPASAMRVFAAMKEAGYDLGPEEEFPDDGDALIQNLVDRCSYDEIYLTEHQLEHAAGHVSTEMYARMFADLPEKQREHMVEQWGAPPGEAYVHEGAIALAGLEFGNIFVALQPPRGYGMDPDKIYHMPDLPPPHNYYALYKWLRDDWGADAIVHMGKHGTLEWLPGKGVGLSRECYPDTFLDDLPLVYPFIINDPGEGMQAKRRAHAVIVDHLTPPMTTADGYGEIAQLMQLVDEYYQVEMLDPTKLPLVQKQILELIQKINLDEDMSFLLNHDHDHHNHGDQNASEPHAPPHHHDEEHEVAEDSHAHGHNHSHHKSDATADVEESHTEPENQHDHRHAERCDLAPHDDREHEHLHSHDTSGEAVDLGGANEANNEKEEVSGGHDHGHRHGHSTESNDGDKDDASAHEVDTHGHGHSHHKSGETVDVVESNDEVENHHDHHHHDRESEHLHSHDNSGEAVELGEANKANNKKEVSNDHDHCHAHSHSNESNNEDKDDASGHDHSQQHAGGEDPEDHAGFASVLKKMDGKDFAHLIEDMDGYLCELAGAQIRDGLHILGQCPAGDQMVDMLQALTRLPNLDVPSLRSAVGALFGLDASALLENQGARLRTVPPLLVALADRPLVSAGDAVETIDELVKHLFALLEQRRFDVGAVPAVLRQTFPGLGAGADTSDVVATLEFVCGAIVPSLTDTAQEITNLVRALNGEFIPAGPSGSPTRGMAHLLPTGRNFYACDPQALPSLAAWEVGQGLAKACLDRYLAETKAYPEHVAISVWGTAAMRTHGDDIAQIFSLLGIRPTWQQENHRVTGVELIPLSDLGRPRIDVTVRISGFFRDAFPHLITLMDDAVNMAIDADEPLDQNFIRKHYLEDLAKEQAEASARFRVFGCPPGAYGIGILDLIEAQNWKDESDFARCYVNWGGYAYSKGSPEGIEAKAEFTHRLTTVEVAIHNQDDREHDIFDSDDYFQFHGGMIATIKALSGKSPKGYFGDSQNPAAPKVRDIKEETLRVYRTRVVNPKWLDSIKQHGYKGASEMAATVDYLFGFDATADVVSDFMYEQVAQAYALDESTQEFYAQSNPWALRGISERLLEAAQRGMWAEPNPETLQALKHTLLQSDTLLEGRSEQT